MAASPTLAGKTLFITGASRGVGLAIALRAARDGANVAVAAKTTEPHPKLPGTIHTAAREIEAAGGRALPLVVDIRDEAQVDAAVARTVAEFGGIDILVNNASAISLTPVTDTDMRRFDLMHQINTRGTFVVSKYAIPHLAQAGNPHILMISPPLDMKEKWFAPHTAYSIAKFGMSLVALGLAGELRGKGIAVNTLWPRTTISPGPVPERTVPSASMRPSSTPGAGRPIERLSNSMLSSRSVKVTPDVVSVIPQQPKADRESCFRPRIISPGMAAPPNRITSRLLVSNCFQLGRLVMR